MLSKLLAAWCLMALCVTIHAFGLAIALRWMGRTTLLVQVRFWLWVWLLIRIAGWTVFIHLVEVAVWAVFYFWKEGMPDLQSAVYFSMVTYTTTGYGDLVLPPEWRMVGGIEALTGILMCGWSTGFLFTVVNKMYQLETKQEST
jgi:hypothetical protein